MSLTDTFIRNVKPASSPRKYFDGEGLFLYVPPNGSKLWRMSYRFDGKTKLLSFGKYPTVGLRDARARKEEAKVMLDKGIDPSEQKKKQKEERRAKERESFENIAREWHRIRMGAFSEKHRNTVKYRLETYIFPVIGKRPISKLEKSDLLTLVKPLDDKGHHETARRVVQIVSQVFRYAEILGKAKYNIADGLRGVLHPRKVTHRATITDPKKVGQLLCEIDEYDGYFPLVCALKLAPLVFTRPTELRAAEWKEFDLEKSRMAYPC